MDVTTDEQIIAALIVRFGHCFEGLQWGGDTDRFPPEIGHDEVSITIFTTQEGTRWYLYFDESGPSLAAYKSHHMSPHDYHYEEGAWRQPDWDYGDVDSEIELIARFLYDLKEGKVNANG